MKKIGLAIVLTFVLAISAQGAMLTFETYENTYLNNYFKQNTDSYTSPDGWLITIGDWNYQSSNGRFYWEGLHDADYSFVRNRWDDYSFWTSSSGVWIYGVLGNSWFYTWFNSGNSREFWEDGEYNADPLPDGWVFRWGYNAFTEILVSFTDTGSRGYNADIDHYWEVSYFDQVYEVNFGGGEWSDPTPTPEPSTLLLLAGGLIALGAWRKTKERIV